MDVVSRFVEATCMIFRSSYCISLPRTRDFQGIKSRGFDGRGNFTFGIKEQLVFPEIDIDNVKNINGMDITIVTTANTDEEAKALLTEFGFPFQKN